MEEYIQIYRTKYPVYEYFSKKMQELFTNLLDHDGIKYHLVESRTKSVESFREKIIRKKEQYTNPIKEITDLCGLRIIVFYIEDTLKIDTLIKQNFAVDLNNSFNSNSKLNEDQFGYLSNHYIIKLENQRSDLPEWKSFQDLIAEVQVRTVLQHSWAAISHELEYKKTYDIPSILKRKLYRLAGLIELADEEFQETKKRHTLLEKAIKENKTFENVTVSEEVNLVTLRNYFDDQKSNANILFKLSLASGFKISPDNSAKRKNEYLSEVIRVLNLIGINTIAELDSLIQSKLFIAEDYFKFQFDSSKSWSTLPEFSMLLFLLFFLTDEQVEKYQADSWAPAIWNRAKKIIKEFKAKNVI